MHRLQCLTRFRIRPGRLDDFIKLAAACIEAARAHDTGAVRYDIFLDADRLEAAAYEEFETSAAAMAHLDHLTKTADALRAVADVRHEVWGNPDPELARRYRSLGARIMGPLLRLGA